MKILTAVSVLIALFIGLAYANTPENLNPILNHYFEEFEAGKEDTHLILEELLAENPGNSQILFLIANDYGILAINLSGEGQHEEALTYCDKAIEYIYEVLKIEGRSNDVDCQYLTFLIWMNKVKIANDYKNTHDINRPSQEEVNTYIRKAKYVALYGIVPLLDRQPEDKVVRYFRRGEGMVSDDLDIAKRDVNRYVDFIEYLYVWDDDKEATQLN